MKSFYNIIDTIKKVVNEEPFNSNVSFGDIADIDLKKQSIFPLAHILVNSATINENNISFNVSDLGLICRQKILFCRAIIFILNF